MTRERLLVLLRVAVWALVGACVLVFARRLDWTQVSHAFQGVDLGLGLLATLVCVPCTALQGLRWASLVRGIRRVPRSTPVAAIYVGQAASAFLPMRAGEAVRTELLARATGIARATALGTVALDHSVNGVVMFTFAALLPALLPVPRWMAVDSRCRWRSSPPRSRCPADGSQTRWPGPGPDSWRRGTRGRWRRRQCSPRSPGVWRSW